MTATLHAPCSELVDNAMLRLHGRAGTRVVAVRGQVWITQEADWRDVILDAGESFDLDRPGLAIVLALGTACVGVVDVRSANANARLQDRFRHDARTLPVPGPLDDLPMTEVHRLARRSRSAWFARAFSRVATRAKRSAVALSMALRRRKAALFRRRPVIQC